MLSLYAHRNNKFKSYPDINNISDFIKEENSVVWLDALDPNESEMQILAEEFGFHPLSIEDYFTPHYRPKVNEYDGYLFIVTHTITDNKEKNEIEIEEINLYVGKKYIVTLHKTKLPIIDKVLSIWNKAPRMLEGGSGLLLYDIMDQIIDSYFPVLDGIEDELDEIEDIVFSGQTQGSSEHIFKLKRKLMMMHRMIAPLRDIFNSITRREQGLFSNEAITYLRNIYDHVLRIVDTIDTYRDILTGALDAYLTNLTAISNQMNGVMKSLTVAATILMTIQIVTGIYGMNLRIPETKWVFGYPFALGLMAAISLGLVYYFKKIKWI